MIPAISAKNVGKAKSLSELQAYGPKETAKV